MNEIAELIKEIRQAEIDGKNVSKVVILGKTMRIYLTKKENQNVNSDSL